MRCFGDPHEDHPHHEHKILAAIYKFGPLLVFQIVLMILYIVFVDYDEPAKHAEDFEGVHVLVVVGFGFLMTFLKKYSYSGVGYNLLLTAMVIQWAILCENYASMKNNKILINKESMIHADIVAAAVLITFGAVLGMANAFQLCFIAIIETIAMTSNVYIMEEIYQVADVGGSIVVHTFGAYFGLGVSLGFTLTRKCFKEKQDPNQAAETSGPHPLESSRYTSDIFAMIGTVFLWVFWPSFNSALCTSPDQINRAVVNTYLAIASATVSSYFFSAVLSHQRKLEIVHIQNSTLAGGVAVGAVCNMFISPGGAIAIGIGGALISVYGFLHIKPLFTKIGIRDTCGVNYLHGLPGIFSGLLSIFFAYEAELGWYGNDISEVFPGMNQTVTTPRNSRDQATYQLAALATTVGFGFGAGLVTGIITSLPLCIPFKKEDRFDDKNEWEVPAA